MIRSSLLEAAAATAARGWRVFPLAPGSKKPRRAAPDWEARATTDPARVERWWRTHPRDNIGIACGPSGLVVIDLDVPKPGEPAPPEWAGAAGGADVLDRLTTAHSQHLAPTWAVATPSGGRHLYYLAPDDGPQLRNTAGRIGWRIDTRAHGGFVVAAGSIVAGRPYELTDDTDPTSLPAWLADLARPPAPTRPAEVQRVFRFRPPRRLRGYVAAALAAELQAVLDAPAGTRNDTLNRAAWNLGRFIGDGLVDRPVIESALHAAGEATGLDAAEVAATVRSALNARLTARLGPGGGR